MFAFHKGTDIRANSPGMAKVQEAQSIYVHRQSRYEDARCGASRRSTSPRSGRRTLRSSATATTTSSTEPTSKRLVRHIRSDWEVQMTNTDEGMEGAAAAVLRGA